MDNAVSTHALSQRLNAKTPFTLLDVRRAQAVKNSGQMLPGSEWRDPALWLDWKDEISADQPVVVYCAHGQEISQALTTALAVMGREAVYLRGGYAAWVEAGFPTEAVA